MANTDYLRFDALSLKQLIINKLNEDGTYSDQLFEGSDLSVLLDVFCYMFDTMTFLENVGAAEAIFTDAHYYENINRIVKMLGYNPLGFIPPQVNCFLGVKTGELYPYPGMITIPRFTTFTTNLNDNKGNAIEYTFAEDYSFIIFEDSVTSDFKPPLVNGTWKKYPNTFVAVGIPYETFTLDLLNLQGDERAYVSHKHIKVFVDEGNDQVYEYRTTDNLYDAEPTERVCEFRLNEKKQYTLTFGDNINGKRVNKDAGILIVYLEANGAEGAIGPNVINVDGPLKVKIDGLSEQFIKKFVLKLDENPQYISFGSDPNETLSLITVYNDLPSTDAQDMEDVESIRRKAPEWFRKGSRLITEKDFEQYVNYIYPAEIHDIKVMNNWKYMTTFLPWLDSYGFLNPDIRHYDYYFTDSCDFNNVYLWLKSPYNENVSIDNKRRIERDCDRLKCTTSEIVPLDPLNVIITPYIDGDYDIFNWDPLNENKIVITRDKNTMITVERIHQRVTDIMIKFFELKNNNLGEKIDINNLYNQLMAIDGVKNIQTSYLKDGEPDNQTQYFDGLSFAIWTPHVIRGADFTRINGNFKLQDFQFPVLHDPDNFKNIVQVVGDIYNISNVEF